MYIKPVGFGGDKFLVEVISNCDGTKDKSIAEGVVDGEFSGKVVVDPFTVRYGGGKE